jgi:hypothetical protein
VPRRDQQQNTRRFFANGQKEAKEFNKLYRYLQENIMDMGRAAIGSMKAAKKDKEKIKI